MSIENLILIPTILESSLIEPQLTDLLERNGGKFSHCGFGPIAATALAQQSIILHQPQRVFLVGIAGAYLPQRHCAGRSINQSLQPLDVGSAHRFGSVSIDGIGVGEAQEFQSAGELGWEHCAGNGDRPSIGDTLELPSDSSHHLLTVCAASANDQQASRRQQRCGAVAEDMEGFAVALACRLHNVPLQIIRGISNMAGDRAKSNWKIADAMQAAVDQLSLALGKSA